MRLLLQLCGAAACAAAAVEVATAEFELPGIKSTVFMAYPTGSGSFPFVVFAHGAGSSAIDPQYTDMLKAYAAEGFIVAAPMSCAAWCYGFYKDVLATIDGCRREPSLHPALASADFSATAVVGHSMGGWSASFAAEMDDGSYNIAAVVNQHGGCVGTTNPEGNAAPTLFTTGTKDVIVSPLIQKQCFDLSKNASPRVYANVIGLTHFNLAQTVPYDIAFLRCHVKKDSAACDTIYGSGSDSLCNALRTKQCLIEGNTSSLAVSV